MVEQNVFIEGMSCAGCANTVEQKIGSMAGVESVKVDLDDKVAHVESTQTLDQTAYGQALEDTPYQVVDLK